jgi:hypothetical protein
LHEKSVREKAEEGKAGSNERQRLREKTKRTPKRAFEENDGV